MLVVADTSALVALAACNSLELLDRIFGDVRVPLAVLGECTVLAKPSAERLEDYLREKVVGVDLDDFVIAVAGAGPGRARSHGAL